MNRALLPRDCGDRSGDSRGQSGHRGLVPRAVRLVGGTPVAPAERQKPPRLNPGGSWRLLPLYPTSYALGALSILCFGGRYDQAHFLAISSGQESPHGMRLPARRFHQLLGGDTVRPPEQVQDHGGFAALASLGGFSWLWALSSLRWPSWATCPSSAQRGRAVAGRAPFWWLWVSCP